MHKGKLASRDIAVVMVSKIHGLCSTIGVILPHVL